MLERRVNNAAVELLSNALADAGGPSFPVIFDENYLEALDVGTTGPALTCAPADLAVRSGSVVRIERTPGVLAVGPDAERYVVASVEPMDGLLLVRLRAA